MSRQPGIKIFWYNMALTPVLKEIEISQYATDIHIEAGGWCGDRDVYLWYKVHGNDRCKKLISTRWAKSTLAAVRYGIINKDNAGSRVLKYLTPDGRERARIRAEPEKQQHDHDKIH